MHEFTTRRPRASGDAEVSRFGLMLSSTSAEESAMRSLRLLPAAIASSEESSSCCYKHKHG